MFKLSEVFGYIVSLTLVTYYVIFRDWISSNVIASAIAISSLKIIEVPSLKVATLLLGSAFFYDIFWVFISPLFFKHSVPIPHHIFIIFIGHE
jgi:signal peptide peptidase-like protein 2B